MAGVMHRSEEFLHVAPCQQQDLLSWPFDSAQAVICGREALNGQLRLAGVACSKCSCKPVIAWLVTGTPSGALLLSGQCQLTGNTTTLGLPQAFWGPELMHGWSQ